MNFKIFFAGIAVMICGKIVGQESAYGNFDKEKMLNSKFSTVGAYLWCDFGQLRNEAFFDFAKKNGVSEIYLSQREIDYKDFDFFEKTKYFLEMAHKRNLKVFRLLGSQKRTIEDFKSDITDICKKIQQTIDYNKQVPDSIKFAGIHLDVEFDSIKDDTKYQIFSDCAVQLCEQYGNQIQMDFSIVKYNSTVMYKGQPTAVYKVIINEAERTFIQSYKNNADSIFEYVKPFIEYAGTTAKKGTIVYTIRPKQFTKGYLYMNDQLKRLYDMTEYKNTGLAIHTLNNWFSKADYEE